MPTASASIDENLSERLERYRKIQDTPLPNRSDVVRDALDHYLPEIEDIEDQDGAAETEVEA